MAEGRPDELRSVLRMWASGVTLVTAQHNQQLHGMTVNSFSSVSLDPPLISVNIEQRTRTHALIQASGAFAVCFLASKQQWLAERFGGGIPDNEERFAGLEFSQGELGNSVPDGCLAVLECRAVAAHPAGTHTIFVGEVEAMQTSTESAPLLYFNQRYRFLAGESQGDSQ
jgi:flavin reductase (DIM6/NTAB) family NADH-FMN oxidoreductase RutF